MYIVNHFPQDKAAEIAVYTTSCRLDAHPETTVDSVKIFPQIQFQPSDSWQLTDRRLSRFSIVHKFHLEQMIYVEIPLGSPKGFCDILHAADGYPAGYISIKASSTEHSRRL